MITSQIVISVDEFLNANVQYEDHDWLWLAMLWAIELAKTLVLERLNKNNVTKSWNWLEKQQEETVSKQEAITLLLKTRKKIESRIDAIHKSDEQQTFVLNKSLLDQI